MIDGMPNPKHPLWRRWANFRNMCNNPKNYAWKYYGGRGITYSKKWDDFETFVRDVEETIGPIPFKGAMLDRKNNNGNYTKSNICWSTPRQNSNNRQTNHWVKYDGRRQTLAEWSRELNIPLKTLWNRLVDYGYTPKEAFTKKPYERL